MHIYQCHWEVIRPLCEKQTCSRYMDRLKITYGRMECVTLLRSPENRTSWHYLRWTRKKNVVLKCLYWVDLQLVFTFTAMNEHVLDFDSVLYNVYVQALLVSVLLYWSLPWLIKTLWFIYITYGCDSEGTTKPLPPGTLGYPIIGETVEFVRKVRLIRNSKRHICRGIDHLPKEKV